MSLEPFTAQLHYLGTCLDLSSSTICRIERRAYNAAQAYAMVLIAAAWVKSELETLKRSLES